MADWNAEVPGVASSNAWRFWVSDCICGRSCWKFCCTRAADPPRSGAHPFKESTMHSRIFRSTALPTAIAFCSLAFAAGAAPAQSTPSGTTAQPGAPAKGQSLLEQLDLTQSQQSSIRTTVQQNFQQLRPQMQSLTQKRQAFEDATPGTSAFQSAMNDLARAEADFAKARTLREGALRTRIHEVLTPTQRTKLKNLIAQQRARVEKMREAARARRAGGGSTPPASH
jgi:Spy/CpxP family protein refolding chaperone